MNPRPTSKTHDLLGSTDGIIWIKTTLKNVVKYDFVRYVKKGGGKK